MQQPVPCLVLQVVLLVQRYWSLVCLAIFAGCPFVHFRICQHGICCPGRGCIWQEASCSPIWGFSKYYEAQFKFCRNVQALISVLILNICCISCLTRKRNSNVSRCLFEILVHKEASFKNWNLLHLCNKEQKLTCYHIYLLTDSIN